MVSYVSKSACRGHRPYQYSSAFRYRRPALVSRMLKERQVPRFLIAPEGYGKTAVALEYAETLFGYHGCFWFSCDSPCFIRDLDANKLVRELLSEDNAPQLVVFDDVPPLDAERAARFSSVLDALISVDSEVVVCLLPSADVYEQLQRDRLKVGPYDLLLTANEVALRDQGSVSSSAGDETVSIENRVAALGWSFEENPNRGFLMGIAKESMPKEMALAMLAMLVHVQGALSDLSKTVQLDDEVIDLLESRYPHLGIDRISNRFQTPYFGISDIAHAYRPYLDDLAQYTKAKDRDVLVRDWAQSLLSMGKPSRACAIMRRFCAQNMRATWICENERRLLDAVCILPLYDAIQSLGSSANKRSAIVLARARNYLLLEDTVRAVRAAKRIAFDHAVAVDERVVALVIIARNAGQALREKSESELAYLLQSSDRDIDEGALLPARSSDGKEALPLGVASFEDLKDAASKAPYDDPQLCWHTLASVHMALKMGIPQACAAWLLSSRRGASGSALATTATWIIEAQEKRVANERQDDAKNARCIDPVLRFACSRLSAPHGAETTLEDAIMGLALEKARIGGALPSCDMLPASVLLWLHDVEMSLLDQRTQFLKRQQEELIRKADKVLTHPDSYLEAISQNPIAQVNPIKQVNQAAPILRVKLFGGMELYLGDERIDTKRIRRNKVKVLLAILVMSRGRDVARDALVASLWPQSPLETARKNFYTLWSELRELLKLPDGTCPYLFRRRESCSINSQLIYSDVQRFDSACRSLLFGDPSREDFGEVFRCIEEEFSSDLLPAERENPIICAARDECRNRLVDALITGAANLTSAGNPQQSIWLSRAALKHEDTREDAYAALMSAQVALGQRTAAIMTFFSCKRVLADKLGLDPSPELVTLYESLLEPGRKLNRA